MDIIDIMLARAMTPQGQTEIYLKKAAKAAQLAEQAKTDATEAVATVEAAADEIAAAKEEANELLETAQETLETAQEAQINTLDTEDVDAEVKKLNVAVNLVNGQNANTYQVITTYPDNTLHTENATKMYKSTGNNEDGTMTQKAITDALDTKANTTILESYATKQYVTNAVNNITIHGGSGTINLGSENAGKIVIIDENGNIISGNLTESELITGVIPTNDYVLNETIGLILDSENKSFERSQESVGKDAGSDFDKYPMFGGRMRCNVADNGTITAFYGDSNYRDDGSNGQVMVYQPKFYYQRIPLKTEDTRTGKVIRKEQLLVSGVEHPGFKLHPLFKGENDSVLEYVLLSAYQGCAYDVSTQSYLLNDEASVNFETDKLSSVAGAKPISGEKHSFTIDEAERLANNRGDGWHIMNMAAHSADQMLMISEFGMFNGQIAIESGITDLKYNDTTINIAAYTGSTASLGNTTGYATSTRVNMDGTVYIYDEVGKRAISYRGIENPWGNIWNYIGGINIYGQGNANGGMPYICTDFNYTSNAIGSNYEGVGFNLPVTSTWVSGMGYGNADYDWVFMPSESSDYANSALPIGDLIWITPYLNGTHVVVHGGMWNTTNKGGPFSYGCDRTNTNSFKSYSARLMYVPTINNIYTANYQAWLAKMGA